MNIEHSVCDVAEARELKLAGFPQKTIWSWSDNPMQGAGLQMTRAKDTPTTKTWPVIAAAPTVAELGEILKRFPLPIWTINGWKWAVPLDWASVYGHTDREANARARLFCNLVKYGKIKP